MPVALHNNEFRNNLVAFNKINLKGRRKLDFQSMQEQIRGIELTNACTVIKCEQLTIKIGKFRELHPP